MYSLNKYFHCIYFVLLISLLMGVGIGRASGPRPSQHSPVPTPEVLLTKNCLDNLKNNVNTYLL